MAFLTFKAQFYHERHETQSFYKITMTTPKKYVTILTFLDTGEQYLFSSVRAILDYYTLDQLGVHGKFVLDRAGIQRGRMFKNSKVRIVKRVLLGRKGNNN